MAFDAFIVFSGSGVGAKDIEGETLDDEMSKKKAFEVMEFNFDVENTLNIGSASGGAGAGKVQFNEFIVKKRTDKASPFLFLHCCNGGVFNDVYLLLRKSGVDVAKSGGNYLKFSFKLVAVKKNRLERSERRRRLRGRSHFRVRRDQTSILVAGRNGQARWPERNRVEQD